MKFRRMRETLRESMATVVEVTDMMDLWTLVRQFSKDWPGYRDCVFQDLKVESEGRRDERIGWDTHIVTLRGSAVGYTDGPVPPALSNGYTPHLARFDASMTMRERVLSVVPVLEEIDTAEVARRVAVRYNDRGVEDEALQEAIRASVAASLRELRREGVVNRYSDPAGLPQWRRATR